MCTDKLTHISASIAPEFVSGAAAKHPPRKRKTRRAGPLGATAQAICRIWVVPNRSQEIKIKNKLAGDKVQSTHSIETKADHENGSTSVLFGQWTPSKRSNAIAGYYYEVSEGARYQRSPR